MRSIESAASEVNGVGQPEIVRLSFAWAIDVLLLLAAAWTIAIGAAARTLSRKRTILAGEPLTTKVEVAGIAVAALTLCCLGFVAYSANDLLLGSSDASTNVTAALAVTAALSLLPILRLRRGRSALLVVREVAKGAVALIGFVTALAALFGASALLCSGFDQTFSAMLFGCTGGAIDLGAGWGPRFGDGAIALAVPLLTLTILAIRSRIKRIPLTVGVSRGMRAAALPIAGSLLLLYAITLIGTRIAEAQANTALEAVLTNENLYNARLAHQTWPAAVEVQAAK